MVYKYESARQWLIEYASKLNAAQLFQEFCVLAQKMDADDIQELYQNEMDADGYFEKEPDTPGWEGGFAENH